MLTATSQTVECTQRLSLWTFSVLFVQITPMILSTSPLR